MENPFVYSKIVTGENFCERDETEQIANYVKNGVNIVLYSKRRMGKTSLIKEILQNRLDEQKYMGIYADVYNISSATDFATILYKAVANSVKADFAGVLQTLKNLFSHASFSVRVGTNGEIEFSPSLASRSYEETIEDIFVNLDKYAERNGKKIVFAIDEFQQITEIKEAKVEHTLRSYVQNLKNVGFIFCGSKRRMLLEMFASANRPFYNQATIVRLNNIAKEDFYAFTKEKFALSGKNLSKEAFDFIYEISGGETWLLQNICHHLWERGEISLESAKSVADEIVKNAGATFREFYDRFTLNQKIVLKILIIKGGTNIFAKDTLLNFAVSKGALTTAIESLYSQEVIEKEGDSYVVCDRLFELWLKELNK